MSNSNNDDGTGFVKAVADATQGTAILGAGSAGFAAGVGMGNSLIAAGLGAVVSPFAAVPILTVGGAFLAYKGFRFLRDKMGI